MTFSNTAIMELGITQSTNIHNTRSLIRTLKYVLDILQTGEAFTVEEYKHAHTHTRKQQMPLSVYVKSQFHMFEWVLNMVPNFFGEIN